MTFYGGKINEESQKSRDKPPCLIIGTSVGIVSMNVRTRELISIIPFHLIFAPDEGNLNILDTMANGLSINQHSSSFYKARNAVGVVVQTATDGKTWSLNIELEVLKRRRENSSDEEETLRIINGELSFVAKDSIRDGSFFNKFNKMRKKRMGMLSKSVPNLGRVFDISKQKIRSSGYGNQSQKRRKMFQPFTNSYKQYEKSLAKIFPSSTSSSPAFPSSSSSPATFGNGSKSNLMERGRWSRTGVNGLHLSSKLCRNERTLLTFLSSSSRSSSALANREISELPEILSQSNKIWTGDGVLSRLKFSPNGKIIGSYGSEKSAQILSVNGKEGVHLVGHTGPVNSLDFSHSRGSSVLTSGADKTVRLWDWKARVNKVTIGGDHGFDSHGLTNKLSMYRNKFSSNRAKAEKFRFGQDEVIKSTFYYLDQFILSGAGNGLYVHSLEGIDSDYKEDIQISQIDTFIFPNAKNILDFYASNSCFSHIALISCSDKSLKVFDLNYGKVTVDITRAHSRPILSIARSEGILYKLEEEISENEDYNLFATYTLGDGAKIWDIRSVESCVQRCDWPGSERGGRIASSIDMSPCSKYLVVGGEDGGVYVFDLRMTSSYCSRYTGGNSSSPITGVTFNATTTSNIFATNLQGELFQFKNK